ncbi:MULTISPECIES: FoF1 ATP synthase subunit delta/epsilon [Tenacibaculum]|uniref:F0F1 ATP synthase subunit epsilon n=1 Tax=Tenacibaculum aiptasiae TaxID=426481 RepID=A0A7J5AT66_9FLAO|nr:MULTISPECIES: F0F1 ATP synthase subunit epsilon [Tenacibaculum]KAB1160739.1 F0F1 ATP synthase subunit epsilon [Tenacibaculum aiptasiae]MCF2874534.1 F0F1 ATP synthase subunit epsilon [Tenacibaculum sp. Cn5-1]MCF2934400.1 F0F1 ATP synthase subunit epsilon [Tenacibaculum sp. Cn5-34]MCG7510610.1 F0F1 ATP synthase subunit epsilon [Tenacibaculum sp. Cn5-46]
MFLEIVTPEAILFSSEVDSVTVPGINGEFQILNNHAPVVSILNEGTVKVHVHTQDHKVFDDLHGSIVSLPEDDKVLTLSIKSGTLEMKENKAIILAD